MDMFDSIMIGSAQHGGGGDDIFGIGIAYGLQRSELTLESGVAVNEPCYLNVNTLVWTGAYKIYFSGTKLPRLLYLFLIHNKNEENVDFVVYKK